MAKCLQKFLEERVELENIFWDYYKDEVWNCAESYGFDPDDEDFCDQWGEYHEAGDWYDDHAHSTGYEVAYRTAEGLLHYIKDEFEEDEDCNYDAFDEENQVLVCEFFGVRTTY